MLNSTAKKILYIIRRLPGMQVSFYREFREFVLNKAGLEIGGPSGTFSDTGILPIYQHVGSMDNVVFSSETIWEGHRDDGQTYVFHPRKPVGWNYIAEARDLTRIPDASYDFLLAAHCLEHIANPVKALYEWKRVLKSTAYLAAILPNYRKTFDHKRPPTSIEHMLDDYKSNVEEDDLTHLPEILQLHDLRRDRAAGTFEQFKARAEKNSMYRCLHHHVFDQQNSRELLETVGFRVIAVETVIPHHIAILASLAEGLPA